jgi:hypothetical protein
VHPQDREIFWRATGGEGGNLTFEVQLLGLGGV